MLRVAGYGFPVSFRRMRAPTACHAGTPPNPTPSTFRGLAGLSSGAECPLCARIEWFHPQAVEAVLPRQYKRCDRLLLGSAWWASRQL